MDALPGKRWTGHVTRGLESVGTEGCYLSVTIVMDVAGGAALGMTVQITIGEWEDVRRRAG